MKRAWIMHGCHRFGAPIFRGSDEVAGSDDWYQPTIAFHVPGCSWIAVVAVGGPRRSRLF